MSKQHDIVASQDNANEYDEDTIVITKNDGGVIGS